MTDETDTRDRVIRMEVELDQVKKDIKEGFTKSDKKFDELGTKVDKLTDILTQAKGAQRVFQVMIWLSGTSLFLWIATYYKSVIALLNGPH